MYRGPSRETERFSVDMENYAKAKRIGDGEKHREPGTNIHENPLHTFFFLPSPNRLHIQPEVLHNPSLLVDIRKLKLHSETLAKSVFTQSFIYLPMSIL